MRLNRLLLFLFFFLSAFLSMATHQRAGEITYKHIAGNEYEITVITYTFTNAVADRPELDVYWGDGTRSIVSRNRKVVTDEDNKISLNEYITRHTFPGSGTYLISVEDANRNDGVLNIPGSVNVPFYVASLLVIDPSIGYNTSPVLLNPPVDNACVDIPYYHNPGAYDPDGDSLSYRLVVCRGLDGENIPGYTYPQASNSISIDSRTGELTWDSPVRQGEYNIAILIEEFRNGAIVGSIVRDMQINVAACDNKHPEIITIDDTCVVAGTVLAFQATAEDQTSTKVTLQATGAPFMLDVSPAVFNDVAGTPPVTSQFNWQTQCVHVRKQPYEVLFKATDNGPNVNLTRYKTVNITVIAPAPEEPETVLVGNYVQLSWLPSECSNAVEYHIYKRRGSNPFEPEYCETGIAPERGYQYIGKTIGHETVTFLDDGSVVPLFHNNEYCYRIVAVFGDGAESYPSEETCVFILDNEAPLLTNVDVTETDSLNGAIWIRWKTPVEIDTTRFPGPHYEYHVYRRASNETDYILLGATSSLKDTVYNDVDLNTVDYSYYYKIELWGETEQGVQKIKTSSPASSVYISIEPTDHQLTVRWNEETPWSNENYIIYRKNDETGAFDAIDTTRECYYVDENLTNDKTYCYYVKSVGAYFVPDTIAPLLNRSQRACSEPFDNVTPDIPIVEITTDCQIVELEWTMPSDSSYTDIDYYHIYYKPDYSSPFILLDSVAIGEEPCFETPCRYTLREMSSITGCYAMLSVDKNGNRSELSEEVCFDYTDCMDYRLPNVFTPNNDGTNDVFVPFPYTNVSKIDMIIYERWGRVVFKTEDPDINWDGTNQKNGKPMSAGVYYYSCDIYVNTLSGEAKVHTHGTISLIK